MGSRTGKFSLGRQQKATTRSERYFHRRQAYSWGVRKGGWWNDASQWPRGEGKGEAWLGGHVKKKKKKNEDALPFGIWPRTALRRWNMDSNPWSGLWGAHVSLLVSGPFTASCPGGCWVQRAPIDHILLIFKTHKHACIIYPQMSVEWGHFYLFLFQVRSSLLTWAVFVKLIEEANETENIRWDLKVFSTYSCMDLKLRKFGVWCFSSHKETI